MLGFIRKIVFFRIGQKASKKVARGVGFKALAPLIGIIGGMRMMRKRK